MEKKKGGVYWGCLSKKIRKERYEKRNDFEGQKGEFLKKEEHDKKLKL